MKQLLVKRVNRRDAQRERERIFSLEDIRKSRYHNSEW